MWIKWEMLGNSGTTNVCSGIYQCGVRLELDISRRSDEWSRSE